MLHAARQIRLGGLDQRVDMIRHPAIGQDNPTASLNFILEPFGEALVVSRVVEQLSTTVSAGDDVIVGASELNSWWSRHVAIPCWDSGHTIPRLHPSKTEHKA